MNNVNTKILVHMVLEWGFAAFTVYIMYLIFNQEYSVGRMITEAEKQELILLVKWLQEIRDYNNYNKAAQ